MCQHGTVLKAKISTIHRQPSSYFCKVQFPVILTKVDRESTLQFLKCTILHGIDISVVFDCSRKLDWKEDTEGTPHRDDME